MSLYETVVRDIKGLFREEDELSKEMNEAGTKTVFGRKGLASFAVKDNGEHVTVLLSKSVIDPLLHTNVVTKALYLAWGSMTIGPVARTRLKLGFRVISFKFHRQAYLERKEMLLSLFRLTIDMHEVNYYGLEIMM